MSGLEVLRIDSVVFGESGPFLRRPQTAWTVPVWMTDDFGLCAMGVLDKGGGLAGFLADGMTHGRTFALVACLYSHISHSLYSAQLTHSFLIFGSCLSRYLQGHRW